MTSSPDVTDCIEPPLDKEVRGLFTCSKKTNPLPPLWWTAKSLSQSLAGSRGYSKAKR